MSAPGDIARQNAKAAVQEMIDTWTYISLRTGYRGYDTELMTNMKLLDAGPEGYVLWELTVSDFYANQNGVMHGGAAGVIFDMATTAALCPISGPGYWEFQGGVTRSLNISYLRAVPRGTTVRITASVLQHGRTMSLILGKMTSLDGQKIYACCNHHKVNTPAPAKNLKFRDELREEMRTRGGSKLLEKLASDNISRENEASLARTKL